MGAEAQSNPGQQQPCYKKIRYQLNREVRWTRLVSSDCFRLTWEGAGKWSFGAQCRRWASEVTQAAARPRCARSSSAMPALSSGNLVMARIPSQRVEKPLWNGTPDAKVSLNRISRNNDPLMTGTCNKSKTLRLVNTHPPKRILSTLHIHT